MYDQEFLDQLHRNYMIQQMMQKQAPQQTQKKGGRGGFLTSLISELGGAGGAAGGAAAGAAAGSVIPGLGTIVGGLIGAGLGGFAGGTGGRVVENEVRDGRAGWGDAFKEGGLDAIFSVGGQGFQAAKGAARAGSKIASSSAADLFADAAPQATKAPGVIQRIGTNLKAGGLGLAQGAGRDQIGAQESRQLVDTLGKLKVPLGSPESTQAALEPKLQQLGNAISTAYQKANVSVASNEIQDLAAGILQKVGSMGGLDKSAEAYAMEQAQRLVANKDLHGLWQFTKDLEKNTINFARPDSAAEPMKEAVAQIVKGDVRGFLSAKVPGLAELNGVYSNATEANKLLRAASRNSRGGVVERVMTSSPVRTAETKAGQTIESLGKLTAGTGTGAIGAPMTAITQQGTRQIPANIIDMFTSPMATPGSPAAPQQPGIPGMQMAGNDMSGMGGTDQLAGLMGGQDVTQPQQQGYSPDDYMNAAMQAFQAGDMNSYKALMGVAADLQDYNKASAAAGGSSSGGVTKVTAQQYGLAQSGNQALQQLAGLIQSDPGIVGKTATPGRNLPIVGGFIANAAGTGQYDAIGYNIADSILRLRTGATANESEVRNLQAQIMPRAGDSPQVIQTKLQQISQIFGGVLSMAGGGIGGNSQQDELANLLAGQQQGSGAMAYGY